jgi:hypothetical protein
LKFTRTVFTVQFTALCSVLLAFTLVPLTLPCVAAASFLWYYRVGLVA